MSDTKHTPTPWMPMHDPYKVLKESPYVHKLIWIMRDSWGSPRLVKPLEIDPMMNAVGLYWAKANDGSGPPAFPLKACRVPDTDARSALAALDQ